MTPLLCEISSSMSYDIEDIVSPWGRLTTPPNSIRRRRRRFDESLDVRDL